ncbi:MAG: MFS transporter [Deltaproteobacteria bacterium]|nr:MFS transporter [Deltaproteobacteria bacterium]
MLGAFFRYFKTGPDRPPFSSDPDAIDRAYTRKRWSVFLTITFGYGLFYTTRLSLSVVKDPMMREGVFDPAQLGLIGSTLFFAYAIGKLVNGLLADRANIRKFMTLGLAASAIVNLILGFSDLFWVFAVLWAVNGWFQSMGSAPSVVSITQWFSHSERGTRYGIWSTSHSIGEAFSFISGGVIVTMLGWQSGLWLPGLLCLGGAFIMWRTHADRPQTYGLPPVAEYRQDLPPGDKQDGQKTSVGQTQLEVFRNPWLWVLGLSSALLYVTRYAINGWALVFLTQMKGHSLIEAGLISSAAPISGLIGSISSGFISDKLFGSRRNWPTLIFGLLQVSALLGLYLVPPGARWPAVLCLCVFGFATGGLLVFLGGLTAVDIVPKRAAGAAMGVIGLFSYLGAGIQEIISGQLIENTGRQVSLASEVLAAHVVALSGRMLDAGQSLARGEAAEVFFACTASETTYTFDSAFFFWLAAGIMSLLLACTTWKVKARE